MAEDRKDQEEGANPTGRGHEEGTERLSEMELLQREVERRLRDNQKFLERFLDEDYEEDGEDSDGEEGEDGEVFEEL